MNIKWNSTDYENGFSFVHSYGEDVLKLIDAPNGSFVLDLGCGNGALTSKLSEMGYKCAGLDASEDMIDAARKAYPYIDFKTGNALDFSLDKKADVIFSNAVFHWIDREKQDNMIKNISEQLTLGGQLVCEFGGYGCGGAVHDTLAQVFSENGLNYVHPFYFPTIGEYAPMLEKHGLRVVYAVLFDRPTEQKGENGIIDWIKMFVKTPFNGIDEQTADKLRQQTQERLEDRLLVDGKWYVDYVRIRIKAVKER